MRKSTQYYSYIAAQYLLKHKSDDYTILYGDMITLDALFNLFGKHKKFEDTVATRRYKAQYVLSKLDKESQRSDALFLKTFASSHLSHKGIIEKHARCFTLKDSAVDLVKQCLI